MRRKTTSAFLIAVVSVFATSARGDPFPTTGGVDYYPSTTADVTVRFLPSFGGMTVNVTLHGPAAIQRGPGVEVPGGLDTVETEIISMDLTGGGVALRESPSRASVGRIRELSDGGSAEVGSFPAESFFDVYFEIDLPPMPPLTGPIYNVDPLCMYSVIHSIPPDPSIQYDALGWRDENYFLRPDYPGAPTRGPDFGFDTSPLQLWEHDLADASLRLYGDVAGVGTVHVGWLFAHPRHRLPAPGAALLGVIGIGLVLCRRPRRRTRFEPPRT